MEQFNAFVYAALPGALIAIAIVGLAIVVLTLILRNAESKPKESGTVVIDDAGRDNKRDFGRNK